MTVVVWAAYPKCAIFGGCCCLGHGHRRGHSCVDRGGRWRWGEGSGGGKTVVVVVVVSGEVGDAAVSFVMHSHPEWYVLERLTSSLYDLVVQWLVVSLQ
jgi:hypothetical protein